MIRISLALAVIALTAMSLRAGISPIDPAAFDLAEIGDDAPRWLAELVERND